MLQSVCGQQQEERSWGGASPCALQGGGGREGGQDCLGCWLQTPLAYGAPISCLHILAVVAQV